MSNISTMILRKATSEDLDRIVEIENTVFKDSWGKSLFESELDNPISNTLVLTAGGSEITGYIIFWLTGRKCHILNFAIALKKQRNSYGTFIMEEFLRFLGDKRPTQPIKISLEVRKSNQAAIGLYKKFYFRVVGVVKKYYLDGEDAVLMTRNFPDIPNGL